MSMELSMISWLVLFVLRSRAATSGCSVLDNQELIENHFILPYYDGEKIGNWKEL